MMDRKTFNNTLGTLLKQHRKARGMSQTAVAGILNIDQSALSRIESGTQEMSAHQLLTLAHVFILQSDVNGPQKQKKS